jgi:hypothetical protein
MKERQGTCRLVLLIALGGAAPARAIPPTDDGPHNSLPTWAVNEPALAANADLRRWLAHNPLTTSSLAELVAQHPASSAEVSASQDLLRYVVTCALDDQPGSNVTLPDPAHTILSGQIGLCSAASPYGDWTTPNTPPSAECLQLVSSCVLALVNARNKRIPISLRGFNDQTTPPAQLLGMRAKIPVERQYRALPLQDIASANAPCAASDDKTADCGWSSLYVGRCETRPPGAAGDPDSPHRAVRLTLTRAGSPVNNVKLRVCKGMYACDYAMCQPDTHQGPCLYSGHISSIADGSGQISFACPTNGPELIEDSDAQHLSHKYGYYSVMIAPMTSQPLDGNYQIAAEAEPAVKYPGYLDYAHYPADELEVFTYREGAFYGNLFTDAAAPDAGIPDPALRLRDPQLSERYGVRPPIFACWADGMMSQYISSMDARWCAIDASQCYNGEAPSTCHDLQPWQCDYAGDFIHGEFTQCAPIVDGHTPHTWLHPLTTYLNGPCDLARDDCYDNLDGRNVTAARPAAAPAPAPALAGPPSPRR